MTRSPLRYRTSIIRSSTLVQASSSLPISRTRAWPRSLPITEICFAIFRVSFQYLILDCFIVELKPGGRPYFPAKRVFQERQEGSFAGERFHCGEISHGMAMSRLELSGVVVPTVACGHIPRLCRGIVKVPASLFIGFYYWKQ